MSHMQDVWALVDWGKPLQKIQQPIPEPKGTEVLLEVTHAGVCHSDLHMWEGYYDLGGGNRFWVKDRGITLPVAMGHEILGNVSQLGPEAEGMVPIGARRTVFPFIGCGDCRWCHAGEDNMCAISHTLGVKVNGGFASYVIVPHPKYLADPGDVDPAVACTFGCSGITTMNAVTKVMPQDPDDAIVLVGAGGLGLAAISMLKAVGHKHIISVDLADDKLAAAKKAGATAVVNSKSGDPAKQIVELAGGPVLGAIDFVNNSVTASMVNGILGKGATWVQVGVMGGTVELSLVANIFKGITIKANYIGSPGQLQEVTRMAREGKLPPLPVTTMPWDQANEAMELLHSGKVTGRVVLVRS